MLWKQPNDHQLKANTISTMHITDELFFFKTHFSTSWHAKMSSTINEPMSSAHCSNLHKAPSMHRKITEHEKDPMQNKQLSTKTPVEVKDNSPSMWSLHPTKLR